jgi:hypothetical protein
MSLIVDSHSQSPLAPLQNFIRPSSLRLKAGVEKGEKKAVTGFASA